MKTEHFTKMWENAQKKHDPFLEALADEMLKYLTLPTPKVFNTNKDKK